MPQSQALQGCEFGGAQHDLITTVPIIYAVLVSLKSQPDAVSRDQILGPVGGPIGELGRIQRNLIGAGLVQYCVFARAKTEFINVIALSALQDVALKRFEGVIARTTQHD